MGGGISETSFFTREYNGKEIFNDRKNMASKTIQRGKEVNADSGRCSLVF